MRVELTIFCLANRRLNRWALTAKLIQYLLIEPPVGLEPANS